MNIYKVWIQIEEVDKDKEHCLRLTAPYEAGKFTTEIATRKFVENELLIVRPLTQNYIGRASRCWTPWMLVANNHGHLRKRLRY